MILVILVVILLVIATHIEIHIILIWTLTGWPMVDKLQDLEPCKLLFSRYQNS